MKLLKSSKKRNDRIEYIKRCPHCGKTFRFEYPYQSYMAYIEAKDIVSANYSSHLSFCCDAARVS